MRVPIQVLVYAVSRTRETPKVLLLRRTVRLGGFWQGVTGAPLDGESLNDAAIRELREETGFEANRIVDLKFSYSFPVSDEYRHLYWYDVTEIPEHVFFTEVQDEAPKLSGEHDRWSWFTFPRARELLKYENNRVALDKTWAYLRNV